MNIKKYIKKINKVNPFVLLGMGFIVGIAVMYLYLQPKLTFTANFWEKLSNQYEKNYNEVTNYSCSQKDIKAFLKEYIATSSAYRWYLTGTASLACRAGFTAYYIYEAGLPTPTPIVEYKTQTQYVSQPHAVQQSSYYNQPVTYIQAGSELMGSNGSTCTYVGSILTCTGGH